MKNLLLAALLGMVGILIYESVVGPVPAPLANREARPDQFPHWEDAADNALPRGPEADRESSIDNAQSALPGQRLSPSSSQGITGWWAEKGGLFGLLGRAFGELRKVVEDFLYGRNEAVARLQNSIPLDLTKHFRRVENASIAIDYGGSTHGAETGASGFIVSYKGRKYIATNIHVLEGFAENEATLTWYEGPTEAQMRFFRVAASSASYGRDARYARGSVPFNVFFQREPSYLGFMAACEQPLFKTLTGEVLKTGKQMMISRSRDVILIPVETNIEPLQISTSAAKDQENIFIVSNPEARGAVYLVRGSIKGLGPDRLELRMDGKGLVGGMSGSPVVSARSGEVVGIVSYSRPWSDFDPEQVIKQPDTLTWGRRGMTHARDFAYRLDNLNDFSPVDWGLFCREVGIMHALSERTRNVIFATEVPLRASAWSAAVPKTIQPDFDSRVAMMHETMVGSLRGLSETKGDEIVYASLDAYRRQLMHALDSDMRQLEDLLKRRPITIPWLVRRLEDTVARDQQIVLQYIRSRSGHLPSRP